ncbi:F-box domain containing protein [Pandoravirus neocaledonia]|uniref:F-box domain containing protein n=1 Tax=Pandoravirus neocaledonia TaxID=2107708 RepID=A0A2U7UDV9_9VIRU|nr:F-box domain containing protein [Pandoravirus neocaledonia]AVK76592.1 F-box domain containing protein [Pandoravirus neocaledonia]
MHHRKRQRRAQCAWTDLAGELVSHIASFLDERSLAKLGCTNHRTHQVCLDDRLWRRLYGLRVTTASWRCRERPCMAHAIDAHRNTIADVRRWLADPSDTSWPLFEWGRVIDAGLSRCIHHASDDVDHRWACAMDLAPSDHLHGFARYPDVTYRIVGQVHNLDACLLGFAVTGLGKTKMRRQLDKYSTVTYSGDVDPAATVPHGYGVAVAVSTKSKKVTRKIVGHWVHGRPHGRVRVWSQSKDGIYYEGDYAEGRPHGKGLLTTRDVVYDGHWAKGRRCGLGLARTEHVHITYGALDTGEHYNAAVYRTDGSLAFTGTCDAQGNPVNGLLFSPTGVAIYEGDFAPDGYVEDDGVTYLDDGTMVAGWIKSGSYSDCITITYPNGDEIECLAPEKITADGWVPLSVSHFTFSPTGADPALAGRTIDGPYHILAIGPRPCIPPPGYVFPREPDDSIEPFNMTIVKIPQDVGAVTPLDAALADFSAGLDGNDNGNPDDPYGLAAARALDDFVFWPRITASDDAQRTIDRALFLDYMATQHGQHWSTCRAFAAALPW